MNCVPKILNHESELFGVISVPEKNVRRVGAVILNAGLLHNVGPHRMHVDLSRSLAQNNIACIRIDQSSKGESGKKPGADRSQSMLDDYDSAAAELASHGVEEIVIVGLCSGADDATYIADHRETVAGLVQLDGYSERRLSYLLHRFLPRLISAKSWKNLLARSFATTDESISSEPPDDFNIRDWPSDVEMKGRLRRFIGRSGKILAVFTAGQDYYNAEGQYVACLGRMENSRNVCEVFIAGADHTYSVPAHRENLVERITLWVANQFG